MTIICLEGPSAVGKTTTARTLEREHGAYWVQEAPHLFTRPDPEPEHWYLDRQVERWNIARHALTEHPAAVLDGDPFQPLWYSWTYPDRPDWLDRLKRYYRPQLAAGSLRFPDAYLVLQASEPSLRNRKEADQTRQRRNFDRHLDLLVTQLRYFSVLSNLMPGRVRVIQSETVEQNAREAHALLGSLPETPLDDLQVFDHLTQWLEQHSKPPLVERR